MHARDFRRPIKEAVHELDAALTKVGNDQLEGELAGVATQLEYYTESDTSDPEAHMYPPPWALETLQDRLTNCLERSDEPVAGHVTAAREHIGEAIPALINREKDGRRPS